LRMAGVWRAVTRETSFLDISGIASIPSSGIGIEGRLTACYCRDRLDVPRSRYAEVTALG